MNNTETLSRLRSLLERVRTRARSPAAPPVGAPNAELRRSGAEAAAPAPARVPVRLEPPRSAVSVDSARAPADPMGLGSSQRDEREIPVDVEIEVPDTAQMNVADGSGPDAVVMRLEATRGRDAEAGPPQGSEIGDGLSERGPRAPAAEQASPTLSSAPMEPEEPTGTIEALEEAERAPASSRRPVALAAEERLAQIAFGAEESTVPIHTPPPESGRLPSASVDEFEDSTVIRGPRADETGRKAVAPFAPESTRAHLEPSEAVAAWVGEAILFAPETFLDLLGASLEL